MENGCELEEKKNASRDMQRLGNFNTKKMGVTSKILQNVAEKYAKNFQHLQEIRANRYSGSLNKEFGQEKTLDMNFVTPIRSISRSIGYTTSSHVPIGDNNLMQQNCLNFLDNNGEIPPEGIPLTDVYTLLKKIGEGGNGRIYLAQDNNLGISCAIKILTFSSSNQQECSKKFFSEIKTTAKLRHPNIVSIFYANHIGQYYYYVMEYIEGKTCEDMINERSMNYEETLHMAISLAHALKYAHQNKIIHRDIKPGNIMMEKSGTVKLLDLGLAMCMSMESSERKTSKQIVGTPYYLAPEQARGNIREIDQRTDIYGFGATLYHIVTNNVPFRGKNIYETLTMVLTPDLVPKSPGEINPKVPEILGNFIMRCLAKKSEDRFQNMEEVILALEKMRNSL